MGPDLEQNLNILLIVMTKVSSIFPFKKKKWIGICPSAHYDDGNLGKGDYGFWQVFR